MLAQNFKTPAELEISDEEFDALRKVLGMLERGDIKDHGPGGFDMRYWGASDECGTPACIGGWASRLLGYDLRCIYEVNLALRDLFFMHSLGYPHSSQFWGRVRTRHATAALRNYLTHGEARWNEALTV